MEVSMPDKRVTQIDFEKAAAELNNAIKEAAYVAIGLGVLGFQRAQVQRVELMKQVEAQLSSLNHLSSSLSEQFQPYVAAARDQLAEARTQLSRMSVEVPDTDAVRSQLTELAKSVDDALAPVRQQLEEQFDRLEEALPEPARNVVHSVRSAASVQTQAFRTAVGLD
jgi:ElaB/YqjD/DUF883 family membrane-anchored ribosome-binding protein